MNSLISLGDEAMLNLLIMFAAQAAAPPPAEAELLGRRLAAKSGIATIAPLMIEKDVTELAGEAPDLSPTERARLLAIGRAEGKAGIDRLVAALGHAYAQRLSVADLRVLVAQSESPAATRWRGAEPAAIMATMRALGEIDLKKNVAAAFCRETGKLCDRR
jgi:hypothetical protein